MSPLPRRSSLYLTRASGPSPSGVLMLRDAPLSSGLTDLTIQRLLVFHLQMERCVRSWLLQIEALDLYFDLGSFMVSGMLCAEVNKGSSPSDGGT
ncbi:hypothetical protein DNTS_005284, partial [Danionella cerebrum]